MSFSVVTTPLAPRVGHHRADAVQVTGDEPVVIRPGQLRRHLEPRRTQAVDERARPGDRRHRDDARAGRRARVPERGAVQTARGAAHVEGNQQPQPLGRGTRVACRTRPQQRIGKSCCIERLPQPPRGQHRGTIDLLVAREQQVDVTRQLQVLKPVVEHVDVAAEPPLGEPARRGSDRARR